MQAARSPFNSSSQVKKSHMTPKKNNCARHGYAVCWSVHLWLHAHENTDGRQSVIAIIWHGQLQRTRVYMIELLGG